jgi:hypothetical protein
MISHQVFCKSLSNSKNLGFEKGSHICRDCKKDLGQQENRDYFETADGDFICAVCDQNYGTCDNCDTMVLDCELNYDIPDEPICKTCLAQEDSVICDMCDKRTRIQMNETDEYYVCTNCGAGLGYWLVTKSGCIING